MKVQISRFTPHQNAKVFAILMAVGSLLFAVPMFIAFSFMPAGVDAQGNAMQPPPAFLAFVFPFLYLVMGYIMVAVGCWLYNLVAKYVGGIEYEARDV
jgi:hypothetical protein